MRPLLESRNTDDSFFRNLILAVLNLLNSKVYIKYLKDKEFIEQKVPFFYNAAGDERFWQDLVLGSSIDDCLDIGFVEGNIDVLPRGHLTIETIAVNTMNLTNRFIYGEYIKEKDGELLTYRAPFNQIPLTVQFKIEIRTDSHLNLYRIIQKMIESFYKLTSFNFIYKGMVIRSQIGFPEDSTITNQYEFTFPDPTRRMVEFLLECETYLPVIFEMQEILISKRMENFDIRFLTDYNSKFFDENYNIYNNPNIKLFGMDYSFSDSNLTNIDNQTYELNLNLLKKFFLRKVRLNTKINVDNSMHKVNRFGKPTITLNFISNDFKNKIKRLENK